MTVQRFSSSIDLLFGGDMLSSSSLIRIVDLCVVWPLYMDSIISYSIWSLIFIYPSYGFLSRKLKSKLGIANCKLPSLSNTFWSNLWHYVSSKNCKTNSIGIISPSSVKKVWSYNLRQILPSIIYWPDNL